MSAADELYEHRTDEDEWEDEPADVRVRPGATEVVSFRLPSAELDRLQEAAARAGVSLSEFIRSALDQALAGGPTAALDEFFMGAIKVVLGAEWGRRVTRSSASGAAHVPSMYQVVPDYPPSSQNLTTSEGAERLDDNPRLPLDA